MPGPVTEQLVTWDEDQVIVDALSSFTRAGFALIEMLGLLTVTLRVLGEHAALHCNVYDVLEEGVSVTLPLAAPPVEKLRPEEEVEGEVQFQLSVTLPPLLMVKELEFPLAVMGHSDSGVGPQQTSQSYDAPRL